MILIPFLNNPIAKLLALRIIIKTKKHYLMIQRMKNSAQVIADIFEKELSWITAPPTDYTFHQISHMGWTFSTPSAKYEDITFGEWWELDAYFTKFLKYQKESHLDTFLDVLYDVERSGKVFKSTVIKSLPYPYRLDAFRIHAVVREKVFSHFKHLFPQKKSESKKTNSEPVDFTKIHDSTELGHSLLFSLADTPAFQGLETAKASNMWEALTYLDDKAFQAMKAREELESKKK